MAWINPMIFDKIVINFERLKYSLLMHELYIHNEIINNQFFIINKIIAMDPIKIVAPMI